jgi:hypothetical protein
MMHYLHLKKKVFLVVHGDIDKWLYYIDYLMRWRGWNTAVDPNNKMLTVYRDSTVGVDIYLEQMEDGSISLAHAPRRDFWNLFYIIFRSRYQGPRRLEEINHFTNFEVVPVIMNSYQQYE